MKSIILRVVIVLMVLTFSFVSLALAETKGGTKSKGSVSVKTETSVTPSAGKPMDVETVKTIFLSIFRNTTVTSVEPSPIAGLYEIVAGTNILYFDPVGMYVVFGDILDPKGNNISAMKREKLAYSAASKLDLSQALKIGNGPVKVIMFLDPDCPYCIKAKEYFTSADVAKRVTLYVFFRGMRNFDMTLDRRITRILSSPDPVKAYLEYQPGQENGGEITEDGKAKAKVHQSSAQMVGITGVPTIFMEGRRIVGFDKNWIDSAIFNGSQKK